MDARSGGPADGSNVEVLIPIERADAPLEDVPVGPADGAPGVDARDTATDNAPVPDARDAPVDVGSGSDGGIEVGADARDAPVDMGPVCNADAGVHRCGEVCVNNGNVANCGPTSCTPCPIPANGAATCNGATCGITCNTTFAPRGGTCLQSCSLACDATASLVPLPGGRFTGSTSGTSSNLGSCGGDAAPETIYRLILLQTSDVFVTTHGTAFDTVLYLRRSSCCGAEVACNNDADGRRTSVLSQTGLGPGTYYLFVDGAAVGQQGAFTVDIYVTAASDSPGDACGNPVRISTAAQTGDTCQYRNDYSPLPGCVSPGGSRQDVVYYFVLDATTDVRFNTCNNTCIDSVLYIREVCSVESSQQVCDDDQCAADGTCIDAAAQSRVSTTLGPGVHYVVVDSYPDNSQPCGMFTLTPSGIPP